jgi:hypothetical protein
MTTMFAKLSRTGDSVMYLGAVAPGPSAGAYAVAFLSSISTVLTARLNSDGTLNWAKDVTIPTLSPAEGAAASSSTRLAIGFSGGFPTKSCIFMLDDTGSLVWESVVSGLDVIPTEGLLIGSDNSVYVCGTYEGPLFSGSGQYDTALLKLNPTTGAITWQVGLNDTGTTGFNDSGKRFGSMCQLSGGDIVIALWGPGSTDDGHGHVQRLSSSDGSVVWTRAINFGSGAPDAFYPSNLQIGIDGSDNIYCAGLAWNYGSGNEYPVVKLASDGSTVWARNVRKGTGSPTFNPNRGALTADSNGVQIAGNMLSGKHGHLSVPADGATGTGNVPLTHYTPGLYSNTVVRAGQIGSSVLFGYSEYTDVDFDDNSLYIVQSPAGSGDDGTYGSTVRATINYNLVSGTATVSTPGTWTRPSAPSLSLGSDLGVSVGTGTLTSSVVPPAVTCAATSLGSVTQFGPDAYIRGYSLAAQPFAVVGSNIIVSRSYPNVGLTPPSTTFGTAVATRQQRATALGPTSNFGTPAYQPNTTRAADSLGIVLAGIGTPFATLGIAPEPSQRASSLGPTARVGTPTATNVLAVQASGSLFTVFGTASARLTQVASGLEPGAQFGTAKVTMSRSASGFLATQMGTPRIVLYGFPAGFQRTQVGTPTVHSPRVCAASGFLATNIGGPSAGSWVLHARSAYFRTKFGLAQAERTDPS